MTYAPPWKPKSTNKVLPVIYSTLSPQALVSRVLANYDLEIIQNCQFWHRGLSDVYLIETPAKPSILRVSHHHWRCKSEIDFELELLDFLHLHQIPVASPIKTKHGNLSLEINAPEGKRYAALFPCAPGEIALGDLNLTQSRLLGETVAKLHQVGREFHPFVYRQPLTLDYLLDDSLEIIAPFLEYNPSDLKYLLGAIAEIKNELEDLSRESPYWGICWGDPHSGNVHFTKDNGMTLFDFDQCGYGWRVFDVAKFWQVSLQSGLSRKVREAFLKGYQSVEPLTEAEISALQALTQTAYIWSWSISLSSTQMYDYSRLDKSYFRQRLETLKRLKSKDWQLF
jgi:Ser/Thr protein kinase RdoA (MazF antagonist)